MLNHARTHSLTRPLIEWLADWTDDAVIHSLANPALTPITRFDGLRPDRHHGRVGRHGFLGEGCRLRREIQAEGGHAILGFLLLADNALAWPCVDSFAANSSSSSSAAAAPPWPACVRRLLASRGDDCGPERPPGGGAVVGRTPSSPE
eukprot:GHVU01231003.1.p2 GENE.GHVU01231003.1~~GHVU01231003.1.p2  ORF type:complete len:148 (-),score=19.25 GHVU01231003.1:125-568(-)